GGVYATVSKGALSLTGTLTLDGENNPDSVFIFQTDSTLITSTASTVALINGAQQCNVFWQVGSSATLGSNSVFVGNILALTSITVTTDVTVQGRALARNGAVTLDDDTFNQPTCAQAPPATTSTTASGGGTSTTASGGATTTTGLPFTGVSVGNTLLIAVFAMALGGVAIRLSQPKAGKIPKD
ncbi:MAG TPA: ice-binding family protein, partial [Acidimicrobiia bacterium]|nr:ice-binding family protein [Acidimicrobiia bacterium]